MQVALLPHHKYNAISPLSPTSSIFMYLQKKVRCKRYELAAVHVNTHCQPVDRMC